MEVFKKHGTKDRLVEMFEKVNKVKVNENKEDKPLLEEGYNEWGLKIKKSRIQESFDSPKEKDEKYLDKAVDSAQDNKYDDGVRYPVEKQLKVDVVPLEKLKGDDKPIEKPAGEKTLDKIPEAEDDQDVADEPKGSGENGEFMPGDTDPETGEPIPAIDPAPMMNGDVDAENIETPDDEISTGDQIEGGLADDASVTEFDPDQIAKGIKVEMEHTDDPKMALEIAMDHLVEIPDYYDHLADMEAKAQGADGEEMVDDLGDGQEGEAAEEIPDPEAETEKEVLWGRLDTVDEPEEFTYEARQIGVPFDETKLDGGHVEKEVPFTEGDKPSSGLSKEKKSDVVKKAKKGEDIGKKGKGFEKVADKAAKEYGSKEAGEKVAAAAMWKNMKR